MFVEGLWRVLAQQLTELSNFFFGTGQLIGCLGKLLIEPLSLKL